MSDPAIRPSALAIPVQRHSPVIADSLFAAAGARSFVRSDLARVAGHGRRTRHAQARPRVRRESGGLLVIYTEQAISSRAIWPPGLGTEWSFSACNALGEP